jgi:predicted enzyme related to lactoylglutathione lyase
MLNVSPLTTIVPVMDMSRARDFYEHKLGLKPQGAQSDGSMIYSCGRGSMLELYPKPGGTKAEHTIASFEVYDIESEIKALEKQGVVFEDYNTPDLKTVNHIGKIGDEKAAWFKDTEGNYLCLHQTMH